MSQSRMVQARRHAYDLKKTTDTGMGDLTDILKLLEDLAQASAHVKSKENGRLEGLMQIRASESQPVSLELMPFGPNRRPPK
jgi:hypothetical protein